jgi:hypothetical protein
MADEPTRGVLLKGADGTHYFIPHTDLSGFTVEGPSAEVGEHVQANAPRLDAYQVQQASAEEPAAAAWLVEGDEESDKPPA